MTRPWGSVSLDLDNLWSYMKTHGDAGWSDYPSYLDVVVPRILDVLAPFDWKITFFVVGQDAALDRNRDPLQRLIADGHELGNHSFHHEPWLHLYSAEALESELSRTDDAIFEATGARTVGFRGPGYSCSNLLLEVLARRGYQFDASTLPTWIGPLARRYYFMRAKLTPEERAQRARLFGQFRDAWRPVSHYWWKLREGRLLEIPVTTVPGMKIPFHLSYVLYLSTFSTALATAYLRFALRMCRLARVAPSLLLHPLDFVGGDDVPALDFFPAMKLPGELKRERVSGYFRELARGFDVVSMSGHAARARELKLPERRADLVEQSPAARGATVGA